jgi:excinuclease ABC subunit C
LILEGRSRELEKQMLLRIRGLSEEMRFEEAAIIRDRLYDLRATIEPQHSVISGKSNHRDVWGFHAEDRFLELQVLYYRNNAMIGGNSYSFDHVEAPIPEILGSFLLQYYSAASTIPKEILTPLLLEDEDILAEVLSEAHGAKVLVHYPQRGTRVKLVELANANARRAFTGHRGHEKALQDTLEQMEKILHLNRVPHRIECFDISTIQGSQTVASMAVFMEGAPEKQRYRRYAIKRIEGQVDFGAMREAIERRYTRAIKENDLPDLVLIDGGKGHLNAALAVLKDLGASHLPCISIAKSKAEKNGASPERFFIPGRMNPVIPPQNGAVVRLLSHIRDEAHRFAITYHRKKRNKETLQSTLRNIPGVGPARMRVLLRTFGSIARLRQATREQVAELPGISDTLADKIVASLQHT